MPKTLDPLRRQIRTLQVRRRALESKLLQPRDMLSASLLERFLGAGPRRRVSPAYYLSRSLQGRSKLTYVKKQELPTVRQQCDAYRTFQQLWIQWRQLTAELEGLWKQLEESQSG